MLSDYKFIQRAGDDFHYAYVSVEIIRDDAQSFEVINSYCEAWEGDQIGWTSAALEGIDEAISYIKKFVKEPVGFRLVSINGLPNETTSDVVKCAAILAILRAFLPEKSLISPQLEDSRWAIAYPAKAA